MQNFIVDSHCHLDFDVFSGELDDIVMNASRHNVRYMQTICTRIEDFPNILSLAEKYENIRCSVGVHPNNVAENKKTSSKELIELSHHPKVIGIGETGLDYYYENSAKAEQQSSFREHIIASQQTGLPIIIHTRAADDDTIKIVEEHMQDDFFPGLIHCFTSTQQLADKMLDLGLSISLSGILTFKNATELQQIASTLPLEKVLIETDSPYLAPVPMRGKRNEPANTFYVCKYLAKLHNIEPDECAHITSNNFFRLFDKWRV